MDIELFLEPALVTKFKLLMQELKRFLYRSHPERNYFRGAVMWLSHPGNQIRVSLMIIVGCMVLGGGQTVCICI